MFKVPRSKIAAYVHRLTLRFMRKKDGSAAVEFSIVAMPFLALLFAIMETSLVFFADQTLESAVADSARLIMTGSAQTSGWSADQFKQQVCAKMNGGLFDCANKLMIDVKSYANFNAITNDPPPVTNGQLDASKLTYDTGSPGTIEVVKFYYAWPIYVSLLGNNLSNLSGHNRMMIATAVFCNEPYSTQTPSTSCHP
ncbi:MAG TPA: TadE/TadG family type IV pilus assembly protein [Xanthobacteraceae bacterium]|nr:TadE/TadG family type IV pilus assembly protein [Xanthobacteraceae bacterium]